MHALGNHLISQKRTFAAVVFHSSLWQDTTISWSHIEEIQGRRPPQIVMAKGHNPLKSQRWSHYECTYISQSYTYTHVHTPNHTHTYTHTHIHTINIHTQINMHTHIIADHTHAQTPNQTYTQKHTHTHTYTHTHTLIHKLQV